MNEKIFIIAGNHNEYMQWVKKNLQEDLIKPISLSNIVYVNNVERLRGHREVHGYFIGTFRDRPDIHDIVNQIRLTNDIPDSRKVI
jgi:hypothetical protein